MEAPPERRTSAASPSTILNLRTPVHMDEALKMREQLAREWSNSGVRPTNEDVVLRAVARAVVETGASRRHDDHVGLRVLNGTDHSVGVYAFGGGASRPFREAVSELAALVEACGPGIAHAQCTVTSLAAFGIDDSVPELGRGQALAFSMGAVRPLPVVEGERLGQTQVLTLTLAYDARVVPEAAAARVLARVRDLVEAPYALLVA
jgi:pyruvate dehydrogenase E2 component (dihydrolipoamide acetyltransferase)